MTTTEEAIQNLNADSIITVVRGGGIMGTPNQNPEQITFGDLPPPTKAG